MSKEKFAQELLARLAAKKEWGLGPGDAQYYRDGLTAEGDPQLLDFIRNTNLHYHSSESDILIGRFLTIKKKCSNKIWSICRFDADYLLREYEDGGWEAVWRIIQPELESGVHLTENSILSSLQDYEAVKEHLIIRPLNYTDHQSQLSNCIYRKSGDIALVLSLIVSRDGIFRLNTAKIQKKTLKEWGKKEDIIWENALANTCRLDPPRMYANPLDAYTASGKKGEFMTKTPNLRLSAGQIPMVTTVQQRGGAIALFYPGVKERLAQILGGSFYAAFISIHECMIHPKGTIPPGQIRRHLEDVNNAFSTNENLTRKVFYYDVKNKLFSSLD